MEWLEQPKRESGEKSKTMTSSQVCGLLWSSLGLTVWGLCVTSLCPPTPTQFLLTYVNAVNLITDNLLLAHDC